MARRTVDNESPFVIVPATGNISNCALNLDLPEGEEGCQLCRGECPQRCPGCDGGRIPRPDGCDGCGGARVLSAAELEAYRKHEAPAPKPPAAPQGGSWGIHDPVKGRWWPRAFPSEREARAHLDDTRERYPNVTEPMQSVVRPRPGYVTDLEVRTRPAGAGATATTIGFAPTPGRPGVTAEEVVKGFVLPEGVVPRSFADLDGEILRLRERLGVGFSVMVCGLGAEHPLVCVSWDRVRVARESPWQHLRAFRGSLRECLAYVGEYEDRARDEGEDAAYSWHLAQRAANEAAAASRIDEEKGASK